MKYNNKFRKVLFEKINNMTKTEHEEIFKIIKSQDNSITYSKNKNGIFFNLSSLNDNTIFEVDNFVNYCINNKQDLDDYDKKINECKINNNYANIIEVNLQDVPKQSLIEPIEDWNAVVGDSKSMQKITTFIEKLMTDHDKIGKKKMNQKFSNAKKKYSKKVCIERKFETEDNTELNNDGYLLITQS
jgi:hypothetical protein